MRAGDVAFSEVENEKSLSVARAFCRARYLSEDDAKIVRRTVDGEKRICVEIKRTDLQRLIF